MGINMICKNCNRENPDTHKCCAYCGTPLIPAPNYAGNIEEKTQRIETAFSNIPQSNQPGKRGADSMKLFIAASITIVFVALGIFSVFVVSSVNNKNVVKTESTAATEKADTSTANDNSSSISAENAKVSYDDITYDDNLISDENCSELQNLINEVKSVTKQSLKLCVLESADSGAQKYAESNCKKLAGSDGALIVVDNNTKKVGISAQGKSKSLITDSVKDKLISNASSSISESKYFDGIQNILSSIPRSDSETKAFGFKRISGSDQAVYVKKKSGSNSAKMTVVDYSASRPSVKLECDAYVGSDGITDSPSENKSATPKGEYKLGMVLALSSFNTSMQIEIVNQNDVWVTDPDSSYYNTKQPGPVNRPGLWSKADDIYTNFSSGKFYACILIEHNGDGFTKGQYNKGSGIFVTGKSSELSKSWGDVNISEDNMKKLLKILDSEANPYISIS